MKESIKIKVADPDDARGILHLTGRLAHESKMVTIDPNWSKISVAQEKRQINLINHTLDNLIMLAKAGSKDIGIVTVQKVNSTDGELGVAIEKSFWNLGLGTLLVKETIRWLNTYSRLKALVLTVEDRNAAAIHVYKKCGFRVIGSRWLKHRSILAKEMKLDRKGD